MAFGIRALLASQNEVDVFPLFLIFDGGWNLGRIVIDSLSTGRIQKLDHVCLFAGPGIPTETVHHTRHGGKKSESVDTFITT